MAVWDTSERRVEAKQVAAPIAAIAQDDVLFPVAASAQFTVQGVNVVGNLHCTSTSCYCTHAAASADGPALRLGFLRRAH